MRCDLQVTTRLHVAAWHDWDGSCFVVPCTNEPGILADFRITLHSSRQLECVSVRVLCIESSCGSVEGCNGLQPVEKPVTQATKESFDALEKQAQSDNQYQQIQMLRAENAKLQEALAKSKEKESPSWSVIAEKDDRVKV